MGASIELIIQKFLSDLQVHGHQSPKEISFPSRSYNRLKDEMVNGYGNIGYEHDGDHYVELQYSFADELIQITKAKCKECDE